MKRILGHAVVRRLESTQVGDRFLVRLEDGRFGDAYRIHRIEGEDDLFPLVVKAAEKARAIDDPRVVRILEAREEDGAFCVISEAHLGATLYELLKRAPEHRLPIGEAVAIIAGAARGLAAASAQTGVPAHKSLTSDNLHVDYAGRVRVSGFIVEAAEDEAMAMSTKT